MIEVAVTTGADLINGRGVEVDEEGSGHVFAIASLGEERLVGASIADILEIGVGTTIMAKTVLEEVAGMKDQPQFSAQIDRRCTPYSSQALLPS